MPIEVRHDVSGGALARLAALSGLTQQQNIEAAREQQATLVREGRAQQASQQAQALAARRDMQQEAIRAQAERQSQAADDAAARTALAFGLEEQVKEDAFNRELETIKARAKAGAEQWEYQYTAKQRADIARMNDAKQRLVNNPNIDPVTKERMTNAIEAQIAGISPGLMPADPNKPPAEQMPGYRETDPETGITWVNDPNGVPYPRIMPKDSLENLQAERDTKLQLKQLDIQNKELIARQERANKIREFMYEQTQETVEEEGEPPRKQSPVEIGNKAAQRFGEEAMREFWGRPAAGQPEAEPAATGAPRNMIGWGRNMGVAVDSRDNWKNMARDFLKEVNKRMQAGERISPSMTPAIQEANAILKGGG